MKLDDLNFDLFERKPAAAAANRVISGDWIYCGYPDGAIRIDLGLACVLVVWPKGDEYRAEIKGWRTSVAEAAGETVEGCLQKLKPYVDIIGEAEEKFGEVRQ